MLWLNSRAARLAVGFMLCAAPALAQTQATINKLNEAWCAAFNKGDAAALAAMYADDATVLPQGGPMIRGGPRQSRICGPERSRNLAMPSLLPSSCTPWVR